VVGGKASTWYFTSGSKPMVTSSSMSWTVRSMRGHLYEHAIAELIRSIDLLNPTKKFYVTYSS